MRPLRPSQLEKRYLVRITPWAFVSGAGGAGILGALTLMFAVADWTTVHPAQWPKDVVALWPGAVLGAQALALGLLRLAGWVRFPADMPEAAAAPKPAPGGHLAVDGGPASMRPLDAKPKVGPVLDVNPAAAGLVLHAGLLATAWATGGKLLAVFYVFAAGFAWFQSMNVKKESGRR